MNRTFPQQPLPEWDKTALESTENRDFLVTGLSCWQESAWLQSLFSILVHFTGSEVNSVQIAKQLALLLNGNDYVLKT